MLYFGYCNQKFVVPNRFYQAATIVLRTHLSSNGTWLFNFIIIAPKNLKNRKQTELKFQYSFWRVPSTENGAILRNDFDG